MKHRTLIIALVSSLVALVSVRVQAQGARSHPVAVALVDTLSRAGHRAEILRFSDPARPDVILLPSGATAQTLAAAIVTYRESLRKTPARPGAIGRAVLTDHSPVAASASSLHMRAAEMLATVRRAPVAKVGNYGQGRWSLFTVSQDD